MKVIDIYPREICVRVEFSKPQIDRILDFLKKAIPLYEKVHSDADIDTLAYMKTFFGENLQRVQEDIERGMKNGT